MRDVLAQILLWVTSAATVSAAGAVALALWLIWKHPVKEWDKTDRENLAFEQAGIYIKRADAMLSETNVGLLDQFRDELSEYVRSVREMYRVGDQQYPPRQGRLQRACDDLHQAELLLAKRVVDLQRSQKILDRLEIVAFPEPRVGVATRDLSCWGQWPFQHSDRLYSRLADASLPK